MIVLPNMGLIKWDSINDFFSHEQLASNFGAIDEHNHTAGKGVQIPYGGLAEQAVGTENLREGVIYPTSEVYRALAEQTQGWTFSTSSSGIRFGGKIPNVSNWAETNFPPQNGFCYILPSDYVVTGKTTKYNVHTTLITNGTAPGITFTSGLYKITSSFGSANTINVTPSAIVTGSESVFTNPLANTIYESGTAESVVTTISSDFTVSSPGLYGIGINLFNVFASGAAVVTFSTLRMRHV